MRVGLMTLFYNTLHVFALALGVLRNCVDAFAVPWGAVAQGSDGASAGHQSLRMLVGESIHSGEAQGRVPIDVDRHALLQVGSSRVDLGFLWGTDDACDVGDFVRRGVSPRDQVMAAFAKCEVSEPYSDQGFRAPQKKRFLALLAARNMIFAFPKKDRRQRLVMDAQVANCHFTDPPRASLPTGTAFVRLRLVPSDRESVIARPDLRG